MPWKMGCGGGYGNSGGGYGIMSSEVKWMNGVSGGRGRNGRYGIGIQELVSSGENHYIIFKVEDQRHLQGL